MATPETTKYYKSLFPDARMVVFPKSAHTPALEETEPYVKTMRDFLT